MKKFLVLMLTVLLALSALVVPVAAQDEEEMQMSRPEATGEGIVCPEGEAELTFAGGSVGIEREEARIAADIFTEACPNVSINIVEMPDSATERLNIYLQTWEAQSSDIDIFQVDVIWPAIIEPHVVDMSDYFSEEELGAYFPAMVDGQTVDGKLVAIPWFTDAAGMYVRTDLLDEYGVDVPETWDDVAAAALSVQEAHRAVTGNEDFWGFVWQGNDYEGLTCDAHEWLVAETGETFLTPQGEPNVDAELFIEAVERAADWVGTISPPGVTTYQEEEARNVFQSGNAAFMRNWPYAYSLGNSEDSAVAGLFDWVPLPVGATGEAGACLGGWQLAVSQYSENPEAAAAVVKYFAGFEQQKVRAIVQNNLPTIPAVYEDPDVAANPLFEAAGPIIATAYPRPSVALGEQYNSGSALFSAAIHDVLTGATSAADALSELEVSLEDLVASMEMGEG